MEGGTFRSALSNFNAAVSTLSFVLPEGTVRARSTSSLRMTLLHLSWRLRECVVLLSELVRVRKRASEAQTEFDQHVWPPVFFLSFALLDYLNMYVWIGIPYSRQVMFYKVSRTR